VRESRNHRDALQPAQRNTAHKSTSAVCSCRLQSSTRPGRCLIHLNHPGWRTASPEGQPRRQVNHQTNQKMKTAAMPTQSVQTRHPDPGKSHSTSNTIQKCDSDQHNTRREANPVGPSHRNSRPRDSSTKPMLPPSQAILAQPSSLPGPPLPFTPPENQFTSDPHTIDYYNQFHSWCTTPRCPNLQLTGCSASTKYLVYAHRPLPATSPEDQLTSDPHTIGFLIPPMSIQVHPSQSNPTHLQYSRSSGSLPDHPDEAKNRKIPKREEPADSPFNSLAEKHEWRPAASSFNHQDPATSADDKTPQDRGAHRIFRPRYFKNNVHIKYANTFDSTLGHPGEDVAQPKSTSHGYRWPQATDGISIALFR
jgi:hypothetical protein